MKAPTFILACATLVLASGGAIAQERYRGPPPTAPVVVQQPQIQTQVNVPTGCQPGQRCGANARYQTPMAQPAQNPAQAPRQQKW
jgi:hypothetical protein